MTQTITIVFEDQTDEDGNEGMGLRIPELNEKLKRAQQTGEISPSLLSALMVYRMFEINVFQPQVTVWCRDVLQELKVMQMRNEAVKPPEPPSNDS